MKKMLLAGTALLTLASGSAMAADLSRPPPPVYTKAPVMAPLFSWTGCYIGGNVGGLWVKKDLTDAISGANDGSLSINSWLAGGQVGCNYQVSTWVFGVQGDFDWTNVDGSVADPAFLAETNEVKVKSLASVTGRVGYAWDRFLGYVKGGGAWEKDDYRAFTTTLVSTASDTRTGWTIGVGGEYAFTDWLTGFVEYDHYDFGTKSEAFTGTFGTFAINVKETKDLVKGGINFKFGGWH
ncbi:MAG TPA: outer membrane beta-barrel protein [Xanthobacteraceae bacterium]|jgi:outer membrane immunogenic protein